MMLRNLAKPLVAMCTTKPKPELVKVTVAVGEKTFTYNYPENSKLAANLERSRVPLEF